MVILDTYIIILLTLLSALIASFAQIAFKRFLPRRIASVRALLGSLANAGIISGIFAYIVSLGIYLYALSGAALSVVYPVFASSFIFTALLSRFVLKEKAPAIRYFGIAIIFLGISIIALSV